MIDSTPSRVLCIDLSVQSLLYLKFIEHHKMFNCHSQWQFLSLKHYQNSQNMHDMISMNIILDTTVKGNVNKQRMQS